MCPHPQSHPQPPLRTGEHNHGCDGESRSRHVLCRPGIYRFDVHSRNGYIAMGLAVAILVVTLASPVRITEGFRFIDGTTGMEEQFLTCGSTFDVVRNRLSDEVPGRNTARDCRGRAITRLVSFSLIALVLAIFGAIAIRSGPYKKPTPMHEGIRPLPSTDGDVSAKRDKTFET